MLRELQNIRQNEGDPFRRVFNGDELSLIIWYEDEDMVGFQLNYEEKREQLSLTWDSKRGFSHRNIDDGESRPFRHKMSPVTLSDKNFNKEVILELFCKESKGLDAPEREKVFNLLK